MMRNRFDEQLTILNNEMIEMGALCEVAIASAAKALLSGDISLLSKVKASEEEIDQKEKDIETLCLKMLLQQQPVARDLRQISAALKMITDMERIGDQASDIAEIIPFLNGRRGDECNDIHLMAEATIKMVTDSVDAYVSRNIELARNVIIHDDIVDDYFGKIKSDLIAMIASHPKDGEYEVDLLMIAKYFERIGDHATNIAEWVDFSVTGTHNDSN